jgi:hypothetical protein
MSFTLDRRLWRQASLSTSAIYMGDIERLMKEGFRNRCLSLRGT